ncbi:hypothetical protein [Kitasatospora sp. NPDC057198]|uniref:hypothetical protein n=1 Tax=Kitasatospora sp. NPDC057198 TaxID=3346046 RepID=UPI0036335B2E
MVDRFHGEDLVLPAASASGDRLLAVTHAQDRPAAHRAFDRAVTAKPYAGPPFPRSGTTSDPDPDSGPDAWEEPQDHVGCTAGSLRGGTAAVGTAEGDDVYGTGRHRLAEFAEFADRAAPRVTVRGDCSFPVAGSVQGLGDGSWFTESAQDGAVRFWTPDGPNTVHPHQRATTRATSEAPRAGGGRGRSGAA